MISNEFYRALILYSNNLILSTKETITTVLHNYKLRKKGIYLSEMPCPFQNQSQRSKYNKIRTAWDKQLELIHIST